MRSSEVSFRKIVPEYDNVPVADRKEMEIVEIKFPDGKVSAFPATDVNPESGQRYCDLYATKYGAFKRGAPDYDRVAQLKAEISERQAELDSFKDDKRVQENLGYGKIKPDEDPHNTNKPTPPAAIGSAHGYPGALGQSAPPVRTADPTTPAPVLGQPKHENII